ncbi:hypothetical protein LWI29_027464 [Acer saccharum]|uniref:Mediator complex subunit 15 KIX domain-containing protein n=1 Tax=Acer saccharum TaxID=4024 RepID=A0AA39SXU2_ACESA|nr:hypothetical protein LWI29_027464 [Acer saccharum]
MGRRNEVIVLDQLQFLRLTNLPKLRRFCSEAEVASSSDQEKQMLDTPMPFFDGKPTSPLGESSMDADDWRNQLMLDSRRRIINKILDTLKRHHPFSDREALKELRKVAVTFEKKIYTCASNQSDYLRRISLKMLSLEAKSQDISLKLPSCLNKTQADWTLEDFREFFERKDEEYSAEIAVAVANFICPRSSQQSSSPVVPTPKLPSSANHLPSQQVEFCQAPTSPGSVASDHQSTAGAPQQAAVHQVPAAPASVAPNSQTSVAATSCDSSDDFVTTGMLIIADIEPGSALPSETATLLQSPTSVTAPPSPNKHPMITRAKNNVHKPVHSTFTPSSITQQNVNLQQSSKH